jgi:peptide chain release factor 1
MLEVRAGTGWEEAALFAWELARAYINFAEEKGFKTEIVEQSDSETGWVREIIMKINWDWAYSIFKYEWWTHRVQRIPTTESKWRVHTSAITVAVLPEVDDVDIDIKNEDVRMDFFRASGAGGQHVNKTESAVRLTHLPTWIVAECQDWRSQHANRDKAWEVLRARIYAAEEERKAKELWEERLAQVWSGDRSEKIRTYNFPQDRITDHRIGQNFSWIPQVMTGKLAPIVEALWAFDQAQKLENAAKWTK